MITITKQNDGILFEFEDSKKYLYGNGSILVPFNTLSIVADESDMITLKKAASNDVFLSARYDTDFGFRSKDDAIDELKGMLFAETGGGSGSGVTPSEVQTMIDESISGKADTSDVTAVANDVQTVSGQVATKVATTDFNAYSAATDSRIAEDEEVTAAALNNLDAALSGKVDTSAVTAVNDALTAHTSDSGIHVTQADKTAWNAKAEPYSAGTGIEISGNVISATGGGGATYSAGTNISIDTANTINCTLPITANTNNLQDYLLFGSNFSIYGGNTNGRYHIAIGKQISNPAYTQGQVAICPADTSSASNSVLTGDYPIGIGHMITSRGYGAVAIGDTANANGNNYVAIGKQTNATGTTKMNLNNQIKVDTNNQVYIKDKDNVNEVCIQDAIAALGGLKLVKISQSEYDNLATKDNDTLYIISNVVS